MVRLQPEPIDVSPLIASARAGGDGGIAVFLGTVRDKHDGKRVLFLEYEVYPGMAERELERIERDTLARFAVSRVALVHRLGRLETGETSVAVVVAAPHRAAAMEACRFAIDTLKETVPIWKREHLEDGAVWIEGPRREPAR